MTFKTVHQKPNALPYLAELFNVSLLRFAAFHRPLHGRVLFWRENKHKSKRVRWGVSEALIIMPVCRRRTW